MKRYLRWQWTENGWMAYVPQDELEAWMAAGYQVAREGDRRVAPGRVVPGRGMVLTTTPGLPLVARPPQR